jgi:hypothetical protein
MLALMGSTVSDNSALSPVSQGGGILNSGTLTLANSTVSGNTAAFLDELCSGNSIANWGTLTLVISTLSGEAGPNCLVSNEGTFDVASSIIDGTCEGDVTSNGYNIESPGDTCGFDQSTDQVNVSAGALALQPLADNGGPTETHALGEGSVAIDQIPAEDCVDVEGEPLTTDQRGEPRPGGAMCDVGAFEVQQGSL